MEDNYHAYFIKLGKICLGICLIVEILDHFRPFIFGKNVLIRGIQHLFKKTTKESAIGKGYPSVSVNPRPTDRASIRIPGVFEYMFIIRDFVSNTEY